MTHHAIAKHQVKVVFNRITRANHYSPTCSCGWVGAESFTEGTAHGYAESHLEAIVNMQADRLTEKQAEVARLQAALTEVLVSE